MWKNSLLRELAVVLAIKFILLAALWYQFFYQPNRPVPGAKQISRTLLASPSHAGTSAQEARRDH